MKRFITIVLSTIILLSICGCGLPIASAQYSNAGYTYDDMDTLAELIDEQTQNMRAAHQMAQAARQLGYSEDHEILKLAKEEYSNAKEAKSDYQAIYDDLKNRWHQKEVEYPAATYIWSYLKEQKYSNEVCAGILGNIMTEVGGNTLDIDYSAQSKRYYGICQWNATNYSEVWGASLEEQCKYLSKTIEYEINSYGSYLEFLKINTASQAAKYFAETYERCGFLSYKSRERNAVIAYNYFVS